MTEFDENNAVKFMRQTVGDTLSAKYPDDDELINLIDLIFDYFQANGMLDIDISDDDIDEDDEIDLDDLATYVGRMLKKDKGATLTEDDARPFIEAYFAYEDSLDEND